MNILYGNRSPGRFHTVRNQVILISNRSSARFHTAEIKSFSFPTVVPSFPTAGISIISVITAEDYRRGGKREKEQEKKKRKRLQKPPVYDNI